MIPTWLTMVMVLGVLSGCHGEGKRRDDPTGSAVSASASVSSASGVGEVHIPPRLVSVDMGTERNGKAQRVRCETCHTLRPEVPVPTSVAALDDFHVGMTFAHGPVECTSCHASGQPPRLRLASGELLATREALRLCAQCHGPQYRDYVHGAHGGMSGYWDSTRGARVRNHCVDCHDPHAPRITAVIPDPPPRDRYFTRGEHQ